MKKYILYLIAFVLYASKAYGQAIGSWKTYPALQISTYNVPIGNKIYSLCDGNLFSYDTETSEVYVFDRINGLHDSQIEFIRYCDATQKLLLLYENGNIDLIYPDYSVSNMKQLKDKNYPNFYINSVSIVDEKAYICTNFGIIVANTEKEEFEATYDLGINVSCCTADAERIYMCSSNGLNVGDRSLNLLDRNNWEHVSGAFFHELFFFQGQLVGYGRSAGLYTVDPERNYSVTNFLNARNPWFFHHDGVIVTGNASSIYVFDHSMEGQEIKLDNTFNHMSYDNGTYWASQGLAGLQPYRLADGQFTASGSAIQPNSPVRDYFCNMHYDGYRLLVAGGDVNYSNIHRDGTVMYYENGMWHNFSEEGIEETTGTDYANLNSIAQDPADPTHHFVSSANHGIYEFKDLQFVKKYDCTNSVLQSIYSDEPDPWNYVRCEALQYDADGNLWLINSLVDTTLVVLKKDGTWKKLYYEELELAPNLPDMFFDAQGRLWVLSKRSTWEGIFVLDHKGTIDDTSDDTHVKRSEITNQDGILYDPYYFNCFTQDLNGQIWVGTNLGLFIIENPDDFVQNDDFRYMQIKIARDDGTEYADYLLNNVTISAIAVDAANRKWIGTASDGIYLISADGQEIIQHFTTENSPLISDEIQSIAVNPQTGEIMIGTMLGLVSYTSDANTPSATLEKSNVRVYPNPVSPQYNGVITVDGLTLNAEVKITTITGQLVYSGNALGGRFTWNGRDQRGKRVSSGVYNIISTNAEGKKAIVNRVTFIH